MLSYRHAFHAGNFADVLKHSVLCLLVEALKQKDKPFVYIDTHAGAGRYNLNVDFALKTNEYRQGIGRLWELKTVHPLVAGYLAAVRRINKGALRFYPGSPALVRQYIRNQDRMRLSELHGSDFVLLRDFCKKDRRVSVVQEDGLVMLLKKLPPIQRRGLVLIDPSYEIKSDYMQVVDTLIAAHRRFASGIFCLWYPVIKRPLIESLLQRMQASGIRRQLRIEHCIQPDNSALDMTGSGLLIINPPWRLDEQVQDLLPWLDQSLSDGDGHYLIDWLAPER